MSSTHIGKNSPPDRNRNEGEPHGTAQGHHRTRIVPRSLQDGSVRMDYPSRGRWFACQGQNDRPQQRGRSAASLAGSR